MNKRELQKIVHYDRETGVFTWAVDRNYKTKAGSVAGSVNQLRLFGEHSPYAAQLGASD